MQALILIGNPISKQEYIKKFVLEKNIQAYNITRYEEPLKIAEVRQIKKSLSYTLPPDQKRLIVIRGDPSADAQNALLKTLEELEDDTYVIFSGSLELLPTILSRCLVISLDNQQESKITDEKVRMVEKMFESDTISSRFAVIESFFAEKENSFEDVMATLHFLLLTAIENKEFSKANKYQRLLKGLLCENILVASNNLNPRLVIEKSALS